jgi:hypothetical protein
MTRHLNRTQLKVLFDDLQRALSAPEIARRYNTSHILSNRRRRAPRPRPSQLPREALRVLEMRARARRAADTDAAQDTE